MSVDTSTEAVEQCATAVFASGWPGYVYDGHVYAGDDIAALLRALAAERDALREARAAAFQRGAEAMEATTKECLTWRSPDDFPTEPLGIAAIYSGEAVAVPVEPTMDMLYAAAEKDNQAYCGGSQHGADDETIYAAMLAASPYKQEQST